MSKEAKAQKFAELAKEKFAEFTRRANVDVKANRKLAEAVHALEEKAEKAKSRMYWCGVCQLIGFIAIGCAILGIINNYRDRELLMQVLMVLAGGVALYLGSLIAKRIIGRGLARLETEIAAKQEVGFKQLEALNAMYGWYDIDRLMEAAVPEIAFDPYFTAERHEELKRLGAWNGEVGEGQSIILALSGVANGHPFVFGQYVESTMGEKTYAGELEISWNEWERDSEGKREKVRQTEKLHAEVTKPAPVYEEKLLLVAGGKTTRIENVDLNADPEKFRHWEYDAAAECFKEFATGYFDGVYSALEPLLAQPRGGSAGIGADAGKEASTWEHEAAANNLGTDKFHNPECATRSILKTRLIGREDGWSTIAVTASGYRGETREVVESVFGGDHKWHDVTVEWIEYFPVEGSGRMYLAEGEAGGDAFRRRFANAEHKAERRSVKACVA